jgi:hypothetical protein
MLPRNVGKFVLLKLITVFVFLLGGCAISLSPQITELPGLEFSVGPCDESAVEGGREPRVEVSTQGEAVYISQDLRYVCCAEISLALEVDGDLVKIVETNEGEICRCMCFYHIDAKVWYLPPGSYRVEIWGVQYEDVHPLELLGEADIEVEAR